LRLRISCQAREIVPVDGVVVRGSAKLEPFTPDAPEIEVHQASAVVAGRCVLEGGPLHVAANRTGRERAFSLVLQEGKGSLIDDYSIVRVGRWLAVGIAPILALLSTIVSLYLASTWWRAVFVGAATWLAWSTPILHRALRERIWWVLGEAAARGIVFPRASVLETSSHVGTAVFCTRHSAQGRSRRRRNPRIPRHFARTGDFARGRSAPQRSPSRGPRHDRRPREHVSAPRDLPQPLRGHRCERAMSDS
jgi:hypothetical protein